MDACVTVERRAPARLLEYKPGAFVALAAHATLELVHRPAISPVPGAPYYCLGLMQWSGRWLPVIDLNSLVRAYADPRASDAAHVLVLAWQPAPGAALEYGAVCAAVLPKMIEVDDSSRCELPDDSDLWPWVSMACFDHEGRSVPVLDTSRLFGGVHG